MQQLIQTTENKIQEIFKQINEIELIKLRSKENDEN